MSDEFPDEEPTTAVSLSMHSGTIGAVRSKVGERGVSAYVEAAVRRQLERDNLVELIAAAEAKQGRLTVDEVEAKRKVLAEARARRRRL